MADGDEKIDQMNRVNVLNRVSDGPTEVVFGGVVIVWKAGEVRSIQADEAAHFITKSTLRQDPMHEYAPIEKLVIIDEQRQPVTPGASVEPLTVAQCKEIAKFGLIDTTNLPKDRQVGGMFLQDPETGQYPEGLAIRGAAKGGPAPGPALPPVDRAGIDRALDPLAP